MPALTDALRERPLVLDGGLGTHLEERGNDLSGRLWSARLLRDDPAEVRATHAAFVDAGADVLITASYQLGFGCGIDDDEVEALLRRSVDVARDAGGRFVAASVGPYGAMRADGSEYTGDYDLGVAELRAWHRRRLHVLADSGADVLAIETIASEAEVEALCAELDGLGMPAWISLSASSTAFADGSLRDALAVAASGSGVIAVGVNCCPPEDVDRALAQAPAGVDTVVYPNSGEQWDAATRRWRGTPGVPTAAVQDWVSRGARLVGGCCRTTPTHIAALSAAIRG
ncbi:homocysteine S-methyltransferase [Planococcus sp. APC 4015]|nr:homocysteine S-methyltransferase [Planococcus sp. APC 4015]